MTVSSELRETFCSGVTRAYQWRINQLKALKTLLTEKEEHFVTALKTDLGKCYSESVIFEMDLLVAEINNTIDNLQSWMKPEKVTRSMLYKAMNASCYIHKEPFGVALIIGAWNYPVQLLLLPMVGAIAAGNCAVIKPSEVAPATASAIAELIPQYLDQKAIRVVCGGVPETTELLKENFDIIFYTGNSTVARIVMEAAAKNLTPVLLELGGKSPVFVDESVDLNLASHRIAWGKFANCGQTCVAPDYIMALPSVRDQLVLSLKNAITEFYGEDPHASSDYGRIVNERHFKRVIKFLEDADVIHGGNNEESDRYIAPTILGNVTTESNCMKEEIFGPVLPIMTVASESDALSFINSRNKPLALYLFSNKKDTLDRFKKETSSGALLVNDVMIHGGCMGLPFGGIGESGIGKYHGQFSFNSFTHQKACLEGSGTMLESGNSMLRYPPYTDKKLSWARWAIAGKGATCSIM